MTTLANLQFEMERRVVVFKSTTTMPDNTLLGYNGDPNMAALGVNPGQTLIYMCPFATFYIEDNGELWYKKTVPNTWVKVGGAGGGTLSEAPLDGRMYGRKDGAWTEVVSSGGGLEPGGDFDSPLGTIVQIAHDNDLTGWVPCNGQELSRVGYANLFAITGTRNGEGNGVDTFNAPLVRKALILKEQVVTNSGSVKGWRGIFANSPDGSVYYTENAGSIYRQAYGSGALTKLIHPDDDYRGIFIDTTGVLYVCVDDKGVFTAPTDNSPLNALPIASLTGKKSWVGITEDVEGSLWVATNRGGVFKKALADSDFTEVSFIKHRAYRDIKASPFGVYLCEFQGSVWFIPNGSSEMFDLTPFEKRKWRSLAFDNVNLDLYATTDEGDLYIQSGLKFTLEKVSNVPAGLGTIDVSNYGVMYAGSHGRRASIYKAQVYRHIIRYL